MIDREQIAHDLAMVYLQNRYGAEVSGEFSVETWGDDVTGSGRVETNRLPTVNSTRMVRGKTGEKRFLGLINKYEDIDTGEYKVDDVFVEMIDDYNAAYERFLELITRS